MRDYAPFFEFEAPDKQTKEHDVVRLFIEAAPQLGLSNPESNTPDPPDCRCLDAKGRPVAVEVTEIVDALYASGQIHKRVAAAARRVPESQRVSEAPLTVRSVDLPAELRNAEFKEWTAEELHCYIRSKLSQKDKAEFDLAAFPGGYIVVLFTDEWWLTETFVRTSLKNEVFGPFERINAAYVLISYESGEGGSRGGLTVVELTTRTCA